MPRCHVFSHLDGTHIPRFNVDSFVNFGKCPFAQANSIRVLVENTPTRKGNSHHLPIEQLILFVDLTYRLEVATTAGGLPVL